MAVKKVLNNNLHKKGKWRAMQNGREKRKHIKRQCT